jgi:hypothetical protein
MSAAMTRVTLGYDSSGRPLVVNRRTEAMLKETERRSGVKVTIVQGSYRGSEGASASAGTHDGGGVLDLRTWNLTVAQRGSWTYHARAVGFIVWYRTTAQGFDPHLHVVAKGDSDLSASAAQQVKDAAAGLNGLRSRGRDTSNLRVPTFDYARWLAEESGQNVTIAMRAVQMAAAGQPISGMYLADARQFLAWGRAVGAVPAITEKAWLTTYKFLSGRLFTYSVRRVQAHFGLLQDGVFGPQTARAMMRYGYHVIDLSGRTLK